MGAGTHEMLLSVLLTLSMSQSAAATAALASVGHATADPAVPYCAPYSPVPLPSVSSDVFCLLVRSTRKVRRKRLKISENAEILRNVHPLLSSKKLPCFDISIDVGCITFFYYGFCVFTNF